MSLTDRYAAVVTGVLETIRSGQQEAIETAASWLSRTLQKDGLLYVTGSGHSHMLAEEVFYRAGGLAAVYPLLEPSLMLHEGAVKSSSVERLEGFAKLLLTDTGMGENDLLVVASNSGRNAFPVEVALEARERGCKTVAITSLTHSRQVSSRHSSGKRLFEVADLVIDNGVPYGDASLELAGFDTKLGPVSTIAGAFIINALVAEAVALVLEAGHKPEVFVSANAQAGQTVDLPRWQKRIKRL